MSNLDFSIVDDIVAKHDHKATAIISILQEIQEHYHYIPKEFFPRIADKLGISQAKAYSVATFYENFSLEPKGKYVIRICDGTACHVRKSIPILEKLRKELGLTDGQKTTPDLMFTVEIVSCLGACGLAPVLTVNEDVYGRLTEKDIDGIIAKYAD
ncbi:MAG: NAD(P)H-dependent oxidoreductase subunit E [Clostridia bacterium]|nr:NAD(P)H-dependent oxidoreductase subunit E [Clostridia bacterium]